MLGGPGAWCWPTSPCPGVLRTPPWFPHKELEAMKDSGPTPGPRLPHPAVAPRSVGGDAGAQTGSHPGQGLPPQGPEMAGAGGGELLAPCSSPPLLPRAEGAAIKMHRQKGHPDGPPAPRPAPRRATSLAPDTQTAGPPGRGCTPVEGISALPPKTVTLSSTIVPGENHNHQRPTEARGSQLGGGGRKRVWARTHQEGCVCGQCVTQCPRAGAGPPLLEDFTGGAGDSQAPGPPRGVPRRAGERPEKAERR